LVYNKYLLFNMHGMNIQIVLIQFLRYNSDAL